MSRPDIMFHMSVLCQHMHNPSLQCYEAAQSLLLYVGKTRDLSIRYSANYKIPAALQGSQAEIRNKYGLHAYSDSSWTVPKSMSGYGVFLAGGPVSFASRKINVIADSSALAEYSAVSACSKELSFVRNLLNELNFTVNGPIILAVDNTASIKIAENVGVTKLTKHFDFAVHRIRDEVEALRAKLIHVPTSSQLADIFTKALDEATFLSLRKHFFVC